jgi:uncharacterized protein
MPAWTTFAAITGVVLALLLVLSHLTQSAFEDAPFGTDDGNSQAPGEQAATVDGSTGDGDATDERTGSESIVDPGTVDSSRGEADAVGSRDDKTGSPYAQQVEPAPSDRSASRRPDGPESLTTGMLLANVAGSQGLFALVLVGAVFYTGIPADALGIEFSWAYVETGLVVGTAAGIILYVANELGAATASRLGFDHDEGLRELLAPKSTRGWIALLGVVLPIIAVFEELLFRAALIGAMEAGFGVSPWLLAVLSSVAFALGHGVQGSVGVIVTGALGFVLAGLFIVTGSFLVVVVAHYLINAFEFVVHEGLDIEWTETLES